MDARGYLILRMIFLFSTNANAILKSFNNLAKKWSLTTNAHVKLTMLN